jgi:hypothetical protein
LQNIPQFNSLRIIPLRVNNPDKHFRPNSDDQSGKRSAFTMPVIPVCGLQHGQKIRTLSINPGSESSIT